MKLTVIKQGLFLWQPQRKQLKKVPSSIPGFVKRAPAKKSTTKVTRVSRPKKAAVRSLRPAKSDEQFMTFKITRQTVYWLVLTGIVLLLGLWVIDISSKIQHIYDQNDAARRQAETTKVQKSH